MDADLEARILDLLRAAPAMTLPLREVHRSLAAELGPATGSLHQFRERLRMHPGAIVLIEPEDPLGDSTGWPAAARSEYEQALRAAGMELEPSVTAVVAGRATTHASHLQDLEASMLELWEAAEDPGIRGAIASAIAELRSASRDREPSIPDRCAGS